jgi:hypothetical protein
MNVGINDEKLTHESGRLQAAATAGFLWSLINAAFDFAWMDKVFAQVGDVFEEDGFVAERDVIKQDQMLVKLPHVAYVRHNGHAKPAAQQTDGEEFAHAGNAHGVGLQEAGAFRLQIVFEDNPVGDMLAERKFDGGNGIRECFVAKHIVRMCWFFDPKWINGAQSLADVKGLGQGPLLVGIHHHARFVAGGFADNMGAPQVAFWVARTNF